MFKLLFVILIPTILIGAFLYVVWRLIDRKAKQIRQANHRRNRLIRRRGISEISFSIRNYNDEGEMPPRNYLGEPSCRFNAHSPYIRCAVNPMGPCQDCLSYEPKDEKKTK